MNNKLKTQLPTTFATIISNSFLTDAEIEVAISGRDVPIATIVVHAE